MAALRRSSLITHRSSLPTVDLVFFGMEPEFNYCRFVSPGTLVFDAIPGATRTYIVNHQEQSGFTVDDFDKMTTDQPVRALNIRSMDTGDSHFTAIAPHIVLFETATGRKGAIKIKGFISEGYNSYILADFKIMKK